MKTIFQKYFKNRPKIFIELLLILNLSGQAEKPKHTPSELKTAIEKCLKICPHEAPQLDKIKHFLSQKTADTPKKEARIVSSDTVEKSTCLTDSIAAGSRRQLQNLQALLNAS